MAAPERFHVTPTHRTGQLGTIAADGQPELVAIASLVVADSPRLDGERRAHTLCLAESDAELPPIIVHRPTMRIIDGVHRVQAATVRGQEMIHAVFFDGSEQAAFVLAVQVNIKHGLPLSLADRRFAATRIIATHAQWSDRMIANVTGLSAKTIADLRKCALDEETPLHGRLGRDGRIYPLTTETARTLAAEMISAHPEASLREVARAVGISPGTVRDVRERLRRGEAPVLPRRMGRKSTQVDRSCSLQPKPSDPGNSINIQRTIQLLAKDPTLRMNESGRQLVRWLYMHAVDDDDCHRIADAVPDHCINLITEFADSCAATWALISAQLHKKLSP